MTDSPSIRDVLDFWFLPLSDPGHGKPREIWWKGPAEFDAEIRDRFGAAFDRAIDGGFDSWRQSPGDQELGCALFAAFDDEENMKHAVEHRDLIERFGRFPHRNDALGRACT